VAVSPNAVDVSVPTPTGSTFTLFIWTPSSDPEGTAVTYEFQLARDALFVNIETSQVGIPTNETGLNVGVSGLPANRWWRVRAWDADGQETPWSETATYRMVLGDGINHGAEDCTVSVGSAGIWLTPALLGLGLLGFSFKRRPKA